MRLSLILLLFVAAAALAWRQAWYNFAACAIALAGAVCNEAARLANDGKMPVRNKTGETERHKPLTVTSRMPWLCDVLPVGGGWYASLGDLLLIAAVIVAAVAAFK